MTTSTVPASVDINEDILEGEDMLNLEELDEKEVLGDDDEEKIGTIVTKQELDGDDLYDAAIEPSGTVSEKRESAEVQSSLPSSQVEAQQHSQSKQQQIKEMISGGADRDRQQQQQPIGKRYCCYIGNMTWWTTDAELEKAVKAFGIDDLVDMKFYENRNNGQSKGFALVVFWSEASVKLLMDKLPSRKLHEQTLIVLPYTKQSLAKLEEATKRFDQKPGTGPNGTPGSASVKEEKVLNIGTVRIGTNGAPVTQLLSSVNLTHLARPSVQPPSQQPTSLLSINFTSPPLHAPGLQHGRPPQSVSATTMATTSTLPPGTGQANVLNQMAVAAQQQQQQMAAMAAVQQQNVATAALLMQQQQQQGTMSSIGGQRHQMVAGATLPLNLNQPPPNTGGMQQQQHNSSVALQQSMSRPPPSLQSLGLGSGVPQQMGMAAGMTVGGHMMAPQQQYRQMGQMQGGMGQQTLHPPPGFPPGSHINPQMYPALAHNLTGAYGGTITDTGALITEAEFQEIMNRNQTVSSSAIQRAVTDAAGGDYPSAIETLVTAISLIRQSRVAHDERCKLLVNTLQDTLNGIEAKSYTSGSRKHRRERSRSPIRTSKRHRRSHSRSRSRERGGYERGGGGGYDNYSLSRRY